MQPIKHCNSADLNGLTLTALSLLHRQTQRQTDRQTDKGTERKTKRDSGRERRKDEGREKELIVCTLILLSSAFWG